MARGTPVKWIQAQGGWTTVKLLPAARLVV